MKTQTTATRQDEKTAIVMVMRDRFSVTEKSIDRLMEVTPVPFDLIVVAGGVPADLQAKWEAKYAGQARFVYRDEFLNPAESRNIGLRECGSEFAVLMDNDVLVRAGWLDHLLDCQRATGASMVVPLILDNGNKIHTAGNDLYVTHRNSKAYGHKVLRFYQMVVDDDTNLARCRTDYGELHCQLVNVKQALDLGVYDENIQEVGECDSGLTWKKANCEMWFEPKAEVYYERPGRKGVEAEDIRFFCWRWDMHAVLEGYKYFEKKWNMDITEHGHFRTFLLTINSRIGLLPRLLPCKLTLWLDDQLQGLRRYYTMTVLAPVEIWKRFKASLLGYNEWPVPAPNSKDH